MREFYQQKCKQSAKAETESLSAPFEEEKNFFLKTIRSLIVLKREKNFSLCSRHKRHSTANIRRGQSQGEFPVHKLGKKLFLRAT